jgi:hypothetical protein
MKNFQRMKGGVRSVAVAVAAAVGSVSAFAQSSGSTSGTPAFSDTAILTSINGVTPIIQDVGLAVLAVVVVAWGFKVVKGFIGR